jgi:acetylornithine deacetylase
MPDKVIKLLEQLVAFDTTSSKPNRACIDFIRDYLDGFGVRSDIVADETGSKACLWATIGPADAKNGIVFAGHSDVVPVAGQDWTSDPFSLTERDGKFFGRGSCDMKAFIACALAFVPELVKLDTKRPIHLAFTSDEETDMSGAVRLVDYLQKQGAKPEWVWLGEPTELRMIDSHKGVAAFTTSFTGVPGHSAKPDLGLNAIDLGVSFMNIIQGVAVNKRARPFTPSRFDPPYTTFNLGVIQGGTAENIIAEKCDVTWQVRAHPGDNLAEIHAEIDRRAAADIAPRFKAFAPRAGMKTCTCVDVPPLMPTANNPGQKILGELTGCAETDAVSFGTEGGFFQKLGAHVVICGPGSIDQAHKADEFVAGSQLRDCIDLMRRLPLSSLR